MKIGFASGAASGSRKDDPWSRLRPVAEKLPQTLLPKFKNPFNIPPHKKPVDERAATRTIAHLVAADRPAVALLEAVRVMPQEVRAAELDIHEPVRRIPLGDLRAPTQGQAVNGDAVINERAGTHHPD